MVATEGTILIRKARTEYKKIGTQMSTGHGLRVIVRLLPKTGGTDPVCRKFPDQSLLELMLLALDFIFDEDEDAFLNAMYVVIAKAEDEKKKKLPALRSWLEEIISADIDAIEAAQVAASSH